MKAGSGLGRPALVLASFLALAAAPSAAEVPASPPGATRASAEGSGGLPGPSAAAESPGGVVGARADSESPGGLEAGAFGLAAALGRLADFSEPFSPGLSAFPAAGAAAGPDAAPYDAAALARLALAGNPGLVSAQAGLASAEADLATARSKRLPRVFATISATGIANPMEAISIPAGALGSIPPGIPLPPTPVDLMEAQEPLYYRALSTIEQPLFTWGKLGAGVDMARAGREAAGLAYEKARRELLLKVGASAESLAILARVEEVLALQAAVGERLVFISEESMKAGFITKAELLEAKIDVKELDLARAETRRRRELLLEELRGLTGRPALRLEELVLAAPKAGMPRLSGEESAAAARSGSLDLALVAALEKANEAGKRLAAGSGPFRPDFAFRAELGYSGPRLPFVEEGWEDKDDWSLNLSVATSLELFDGGEARAARGKAAAELEKARARSEEARSGIANLLRSGFLDLELARVRLEYDILKLEGHGEKVKGLRAERDAGSGSEAAYLRALLDTLGTVADGWARLAEYRGALWKLEAALP